MRRVALALVVAGRFLLPASAAAQGAAPRIPLDTLRWMTGCWRGTTPRGTVIEEMYTSPTSNLMQGLTRYTRDGRTVDFEFTTITADSNGPALRPQPKGGAPTRFGLESLGPTHATWANPAHDFPQRIRYSRPHPDTLVARIEGTGPNSTPRASEWRMTRTRCAE